MLKHLVLSAAVLLAPLLLPATTNAQCTNLTGSPAPTPSYYLANRVRLAYRSNGPGFGDDRLVWKKADFGVPPGFDPINTHSMHVTVRKNGIAGPVLWSTSIPPSNLWAATGPWFRFRDPATTYGVRMIRLPQVGGPMRAFKARNVNITNAPLVPGVDTLHVLIEIESGGVGVCFEGTATCVGSGNSQRCDAS